MGDYHAVKEECQIKGHYEVYPINWTNKKPKDPEAPMDVILHKVGGIHSDISEFSGSCSKSHMVHQPLYTLVIDFAPLTFFRPRPPSYHFILPAEKYIQRELAVWFCYCSCFGVTVSFMTMRSNRVSRSRSGVISR